MSLPENERPRVWLGAAGTAVAFGFATAIRRRWRDLVTIVAADTNPRHLVAASTLADEFEQVPRVDDADFLKVVVDLLVAHKIDTYVPILDQEILLVAEAQESSRLPSSVSALTPSATSAETCLDKLLTSRFLARVGLPTPATWGGEIDKPTADFPDELVLKPRQGVGSRDVSFISKAMLNSIPTHFIVQERCGPPEVTIDAFRGRRGENRAICRERLEVKSGVCTKARIFEDTGLAHLAMAVGASLGLHGAYCIQVMKNTSDGTWLIVDVNPRPGGGTAMSAAIGIDMFAAHLADAWSWETRLASTRLADMFVVRQHQEFVLNES